MCDFQKIREEQVRNNNKSRYDGNVDQRVVIACADSTDFCASGEKYEIKIQEIITYYAKIYETEGGKDQKKKV